MSINQDVAGFNAELAKVYEGLKSTGDAVVKDIIAAGKVIAADAPAVANGMRVVGAILSLIPIPVAGGASAALDTAATAIDYADHLVVTAEGIAMKPSEAAAILGAEKAKALLPATAEQKRAVAVKMVVDNHKVPANTADVLVAVAYAQKAKIDPALPAKA